MAAAVPIAAVGASAGASAGLGAGAAIAGTGALASAMGTGAAVVGTVGSAVSAIAPVVSAAGKVVRTVSGVGQAVYQNQAAKTEAAYQEQRGEAIQQQAEEEAKLLEREADIEDENLKYEEEMHRIKVDRFISTQRAKYAASGVTMEGSPVTVIADTAAMAESELSVMQREYEERSRSRREEATLTRRRGYTGALTGEYLGAATISRGRSEAFGTATRTGSSLLLGLAGA